SYQPARNQGGGGRGGGGRGGGKQPTNPDYTDMTKLGTGIYRSENGGRSWEYVNRYNNRPFYYSQIRINPVDDQRVYFITGSFQMSDDGGKTLRRGAGGIHVDHHAMWLDPNNKDRFYLGNDGGSYLTHDHGETFRLFDNFVISQFYAVGVDMRDPYYVYGGLQDNGTWGGPSRSRDSGGIFTDHWKSVGGGDGFHAQPDPSDWTTVYVESQGGSISRRNIALGTSNGIRPNRNNIVNWDEYVTEEILQTQLEKGFTARGRGGRGGGRGGAGGRGQGEEPPPQQGNPFRFNWSSPIVLSPHNPRTVFFGGNHLFKSVNRGDSWQIISPDLSKNDPINTRRETGGITRDVTGAETYGAIITVSESPLTPGLIWVGTDDGNVQLSRNGGINWSNVRNNVPGVPEQLWVSRVEASHFEEGTAYLTFDGHRSDNFTPWVFKTTNYGQNWTNISNNIPDGHAVYVIKEDLKNSNLLFVGTEFAVFYSINGGDSWEKLNRNMPTVAVHDLVIHPRDGDLIAATHGRGIWILDDITPLQQLTDEVKEQDAHLFDIKTATIWRNMNRGGSRGHFLFRGENPQNTPFITYYIKPGLTGEVKIEISNLDGSSKRSITEQAEPGINKVAWNGQFDTDRQDGRGGRGGGRGGRGRGGRGGFNSPIGQYLVKMTFQGETYSTTLTVRRDPIETGGGN
ncbi:hypothetical protein IIB79_09630, partial [candidate division KSB1 bacterium]|nr:hypothetical protein [candidate division KSB1 bacterium]